MRIISANISGSLTLNGVDVTNVTVSSSIWSGSMSSRVTSLEQFSSSLDATFATDAQLAAATASLSASLALPIAALNSYTSSNNTTIASLNTFSGSILSYTSSNNTNISALNAQSASFLAYTSSNDTKISALNSFSSSILSYTSSNNVNISSLQNATSSLQAFSASLLSYTSSTDSKISSIHNATSSLQNATSSLQAFSSSILSYTSSANTKFAGLDVASGSAITRLNALEVASGSAINRLSSLETASGSAITRLISLENRTGSYATTGSNTFIGTQTISGSIFGSGSLTINGCITSTGTIIAQTINVQQVTSSIVYSSGSNIFGNLSSNTQTFTGSMLITGSLNTIGNACITSICSPSFIGGTMSGTTIYGSTAVCSPVGKFTSCIDAGSGTFSGNIGITVANTPEVLLTHSNTSKTFLMAVDGNNAFFRANSTNNILFQYGGGTNALSINGSTGAACFNNSITACTTLLQVPSTAAVVDILRLNNPAVTNSGTRLKFENGYGDLAALRVTHMDNGSLADDGQIEFQTAQNTVLGTRMTILNTGVACFTNTISAPNATFCQVGGPVVQILQPGATNNTTAVIRQTGSGGNGNQDIGLIVDIQGITDNDRIANFRYFDGTNYNSRLAILRDGKIGVGTIAPAAELQVNKNCDAVIAISSCVGVTTGNRGALAFYNCATSTVAMIRAAAVTDNVGTELQFHTRPAAGSLTQRLTIDASGNLGLGVTPSAWVDYKVLQFGGGSISSYTDNLFMEVTQNAFWNGSSYVYVNNGFASRYQQNVGRHEWYQAPTGTASNAISFTQAMTLDASGRLAVGNTSVSALNERLNVTGNGIAIEASDAGSTMLLGNFGSSDGIVGMFTNDSLQIRTNNTARFIIGNDGNIVMGNFSPSGTPPGDYRSFEIGRQGNTIAGAPWKSNLYLSTNATITAGSTAFTYRNSSVPATFLSLEGGELSFANAASGTVGCTITFCERMRITSGGCVGIGTISPCARLHIQGTGALQDLLYLCTGGSVNTKFVYSIVSGADDAFVLRRSHTTQGELCIMSWTYQGYVGVGTTTPTGQLHICGSDPAFRIQSTVSGNMQMGQWDGTNNRIQSSGRDFLLTQTDANNMLFHTNSTERMRITSGGLVGIGTTSPQGLLHVYCLGYDGQIRITDSAVTGADWSLLPSSGGSTAIFRLYNRTSAVTNMTWTCDGRVIIGGTVASNVGLTIYGSNAATIYQTPNTGTGATNGFYVGHTGDVSYIWNYNNYPTVFATNNTERMRITCGGLILACGRMSSIMASSGNIQEWVGLTGTIANNTGWSLFSIANQYDNLSMDIYVFTDVGSFQASKHEVIFGYTSSTYIGYGFSSAFCVFRTGTEYNETMTICNLSGSNINSQRIAIRVWGYGVGQNGTGGSNLLTTSCLTRIK
jgi:hypothetical protein